MLSKPELPFKYLPHHDRARGGGGGRDKEPRGPVSVTFRLEIKYSKRNITNKSAGPG